MREITNISKKVKRLRTAYGMSKNALSRISGLSSRTISRVEGIDMNSTSYIPKMDTLHYLASAFRMSTSEFLSTKVRGVVDASPGVSL